MKGAAVGIVTTSYPREAGDPAGAFVHGLARWMAAQGCAVEVVAAGPGAARVDGIPVWRVDGRGLFYDGGAPDADHPQRVTDYLAGMTDRYAVRAFEALSVPTSFAL